MTTKPIDQGTADRNLLDAIPCVLARLQASIQETQKASDRGAAAPYLAFARLVLVALGDDVQRPGDMTPMSLLAAYAYAESAVPWVLSALLTHERPPAEQAAWFQVRAFALCAIDKEMAVQALCRSICIAAGDVVTPGERLPHKLLEQALDLAATQAPRPPIATA